MLTMYLAKYELTLELKTATLEDYYRIGKIVESFEPWEVAFFVDTITVKLRTTDQFYSCLRTLELMGLATLSFEEIGI
jgi:hypothetical protein